MGLLNVAPFCQDYSHTVFAVRCKNTMKPGQIYS